MKVSVITVCYNSAKTLERTLKSVADQDWPNVEHIVIDGSSFDGTMKILEAYKQKLAYVISEPDLGIYDAMNKGLHVASGDVIAFLNADDLYASSKVLSQVVNKMMEQKLDALMGDVGIFNENTPNRLVRRYRSNQFTPERLAWGWMPAHPALFLRKEVVNRVGKFKTDYAIAGDFEFIVRVFYDQNINYQHLSEILVLMQNGGVSAAGLKAKVVLNKEVLRACLENGLQTNMIKILSKYPAKLLELIR